MMFLNAHIKHLFWNSLDLDHCFLINVIFGKITEHTIEINAYFLRELTEWVARCFRSQMEKTLAEVMYMNIVC